MEIRSNDNVVSIHPYFKALPGKLPQAKTLLAQFLVRTQTESKNLWYDFTVAGDVIHCREGYVGADGLLEHLENVKPVLDEMLKVANVIRLEVHGPAAELEKLKPALSGLNPEWFVYECGLPLRAK